MLCSVLKLKRETPKAEPIRVKLPAARKVRDSLISPLFNVQHVVSLIWYQARHLSREREIRNDIFWAVVALLVAIVECSFRQERMTHPKGWFSSDSSASYL